jgi:RecA-family ATPase
MSLPVEIEALAKLLAKQDDDEARQRLIKQLQMRAASITPDESIGSAPITSLGAYLDQPIEVPPRLVEPALFVRGGIFCVTGAPGKGKTSFLLNCLVSWASGRPMFPGCNQLVPSQPVRSLIIENEGAPGEFHRKIGIMLNKGPLSDKEKLLARDNILVWGDGGYSGFKLDDHSYVERLRKGIEEHKPDVVFIEPFHGLWSGDENSATEMRKVLDTMQEVATSHDLTIAIAHHDRKSGAYEEGDLMNVARGSGALAGAVTVMSHHRPAKDDQEREWSVSKSRHAPKPAALRMIWDDSSQWYSWVSDESGEGEVLKLLQEAEGDPCYVPDMAQQLGESQKWVRARLKKLKDSGRIKTTASRPTTGGGTTGVGWRIVIEEGNSALEL